MGRQRILQIFPERFETRSQAFAKLHEVREPSFRTFSIARVQAHWDVEAPVRGLTMPGAPRTQ